MEGKPELIDVEKKSEVKVYLVFREGVRDWEDCKWFELTGSEKETVTKWTEALDGKE